MSSITPSPWLNMEENQSCYGGVLLLQEVETMTVWRYHGFFEVSDNNHYAFGAKTEDDDQSSLWKDDEYPFLQDNHPKVYIQICLCLVQGSVIERPWVAF